MPDYIHGGVVAHNVARIAQNRANRHRIVHLLSHYITLQLVWDDRAVTDYLRQFLDNCCSFVLSKVNQPMY